MLLELRIRKPIHTKEYENDTGKNPNFVIDYYWVFRNNNNWQASIKTQINKHSDCLATKNTNLKSIS